MTAATTTCPFCAIADEGLPRHGIYEDSVAFLLTDRDSLGWAHCLVVPRRHVAAIYELPPAEYAHVFALARTLAPYLLDATNAKAVGFVAFGSGLPHAHLHLVPHNAPLELLQPQARSLTDDELEANAERIRSLLPHRLL
jgi:histidine triad (HIT) family protein